MEAPSQTLGFWNCTSWLMLSELRGQQTLRSVGAEGSWTIPCIIRQVLNSHCIPVHRGAEVLNPRILSSVPTLRLPSFLSTGYWGFFCFCFSGLQSNSGPRVYVLYHWATLPALVYSFIIRDLCLWVRFFFPAMKSKYSKRWTSLYCPLSEQFAVCAGVKL
jgi:hypothetical protein